jgi:hypothetical protein
MNKLAYYKGYMEKQGEGFIDNLSRFNQALWVGNPFSSKTYTDKLAPMQKIRQNRIKADYKMLQEMRKRKEV